MIEPNTPVAEIAKMLQSMGMIAFIQCSGGTWEVKLLSVEDGSTLGIGMDVDSCAAFNTAISAATN